MTSHPANDMDFRDVLKSNGHYDDSFNVEYAIRLFEGKPSMNNLQHLIGAYARAYKHYTDSLKHRGLL